jgi:7-cyano-7-deazaguanine synthase in queuosine biosynthesis
MAHEHLILCGSARLSSRKKVWREAKTVCLELDRRRSACNVNLRISDITRRLAANLPDLDRDLLEIAAYVYCADQAVTRGGLKQIDHGRSWYRMFRFEVPVRRPDFWSSADVLQDLCRSLNDASADNFEFAFCRLTDPPSLETYFEWGNDDITDVDEVILFSGGLDSFGGAVREALCQNRKLVLVSHRPVSKIDSRQKQLVADIAERVSEKRKAPVHVPVLVNKGKELGKDHTQRTRSFLYASLAVIVARLFGLKRIRFYENGVTSLNLPISPQVVSTRATRTTHPMVLSGYCRLFSRIFPDGFGIENPFFWKTNTEILSEIKAAGHSRLCAFTGSCAHTWQQTKMYPHCGKCSQCVERRLVALAARYGEEEDPPEMYELNVLTDGVDGVDRILVESYLETIKRVQRIQTETQFCVEFPELARVINHIEGHADDVAKAVCNLYKRHADQIGGALDEQGCAAISQLRLGELPPNCLLGIAYTRGREVVEEAASTAEVGAGTTGGDGLVIDESTFSVRWQGREPAEIGNKKEFRLLQELAKSAGRYIGFADLAERMGGDPMDKVTHIKSRLVKILQHKGYNDLAERIRTQKEHYGLFLS